MLITCASCLTKFNLDDARIPHAGVKVRCSRCHQVFYVVPPPETKEEVMENFESFAKYHEDLMPPGEEAQKKPGPEKEAKGPVSPPKSEAIPEEVSEKPAKKPSEEPKPLEPAPPEKEKDGFLFEEEELKGGGKLAEGFPEYEKEAESRPSKPKETARPKKRRKTSPLLAVLIVLVLLILGLFYLWTELGSGGKLSPLLEAPIEKARVIWGKIWGTEKEGLDIGDLTGYEERVGDLSLFVIEGKVSNQSRFNKRQVRVRVILFDQEKVKMAEKEAVCGRVLSRQELRSQSPDFFKGEMLLRPQSEKEMVVSSGKIAPFMVIFKDPLGQAKEFKVEILEAPNL